jgi:asparagine synthase (glutamine-hydrolysing)
MGYIYNYNAPNVKEAEEDRQRLLREIHLYDGLRVDRTLGYWGLEARLPFLDKRLVSLFNDINPILLMSSYKNCEKYLFRKAFSVVKPGLIPDSVLWRKKEAFSDGISSKENSWYEIVKSYYNTKVSSRHLLTEDISNFMTLFKGRFHTKINDLSNEHYYLYKRYREKYGFNDLQIPYYWLPSWTDEIDPSARKLKVYENLSSNISPLNNSNLNISNDNSLNNFCLNDLKYENNEMLIL